MADDEKKHTLVFKLDDSELQSKGPRVVGKFTEINSAIELVKKTYGLLSGVARETGEALSRGSDVDDIEQAFKRLTGAAGGTASTLLNELNSATLQTISNFDLMRKANEQLRAGLKPDEIITMSKAAKAFAEEDGKNYQETLDGISRSLVMGQDRFLKSLGIIIDNKKAYEDLGKSLGLSGEKLQDFTKNLNEQGKAQAIREAGVRALNEHLEKTGEISKDAGDRVAGLSKAWTDNYDQVVKNLAQSPEINKLLDIMIDNLPKVAQALEGVAEGLAKILTGGDKAIEIFTAIGDVISQGDIAPLENFFKNLNKEASDAAPAIKGVSQEINALSSWMEENGASQAAVAKKSDELIKKYSEMKKAAEEAAKKNAELAQSFQELANQTIGDSLSTQFEEALKSLDSAALDSLKGRLIENFRAGAELGIKDFIGTKFEAQAREMAQISENEYAISLNAKESSALKEAIDNTKDSLKDAYQESTEFFRDIFTEFAETGTIDLGERLKRVAIEFAAQMAASLITGGGGGIGGVISSMLGGGGSGGGLGGLGQLAGGASLLGSFGMSGSAAAAAGIQGPAMASGMFAEGSGIAGFAAANPYLAGALAVGAIGSQTNWFGLGGGMSKAEKDRRSVREGIQSSMGDQFQVGFGESDLFGIDFKKFDEGIPILNEAKDAVQALADVMAEGTDQGDAFAKIFAMVVTGFEDGSINAENMNEVLLASQDLMSDMGLSSEAFKEKLLDAFYSGEISLEQFNEGLQLTRDNLIGEGSVADAVRMMAKTIEEDPKAALNAFMLSFKEASEVAGDQLGTVQDFFIQVFGPNAISLFDTLKAVGIKTFKDFAEASIDQINAIFNALQNLDLQAAVTSGAIDAATVNAQGGAPVPVSTTKSSGGGGGGSSRQSEAKRKAKERAALRKARKQNNAAIQALFADITGGVSSTLDDSLLAMLGGGTSFSIADIFSTLASEAFQGLGGGAGVFGGNLSNLLSGFGGSQAPDSTEVDINTVLAQLRRTIPQQAEFGPAAQLVGNATNDLNARLFRGESKIKISDVRSLLGNQQGIFSGYGDVFGQGALGQAQANVTGFVDDVISDLKEIAGQDIIDIDGLKSLMEEAEQVTKDSFIGPIQDAQRELTELFGNTSKRGVQNFIDETDKALRRLTEIRRQIQSTTDKANDLLGSLDRAGQVSKKQQNNLNSSR